MAERDNDPQEYTSKKIAYIVCSYGEDGKGKKEVEFASWSEKERNDWYNGSPRKPWLVCHDEIVDEVAVQRSILNRLDGIDKLVLGLHQRKK